MVRKMGWSSTIGLALSALLFLAGCGGGSSAAPSSQEASSTPSSQGASSSELAAVDISIAWPAGGSKPGLGASKSAAPKALAASASFSVAVTAPDMTIPVTGTANIPLAGNSSLSLSVPIGNARKFEARVYDGQNGAGNIVAYATATQDILAGANTVSMAFGEVPRGITSPANPVVGIGSGDTLTFSAKDADGYTITNNALVAWTVVGGNANGTIVNGVYTPPANYPGTGSNMTVTIQAASALDATAPAFTATLTLNSTSSGTVNFNMGSVVPTGVSASAGNGQATISWNVTGGATSYKVYYGTTSGVNTSSPTFVSGITNTFTTITGLTNGTTYYFVVVAVNATSQTGISSQVSAIPSVPPVAAPINLSTVSGNAQITLSWTAVANAASYNVYWSTTTGAGTAGTKVPVTSGTSYTITGLTNGTTYYFVVTAVNSGGESAVSSQISAVPYSLIAIAQVSTGGGHTVVLKGDGTVWAFGTNGYGQLGDGTTTARTSPVQVVGPNGVGFLTGVVSIAAAVNHTVAVKSDGTVWAWGGNGSGELGDNTATNRYTPVQVFGGGGVGYLSGITAVSCGDSHSIAIKNDGTVWAWGYNYYGQLGDGTSVAKYYPVQVKGVGGTGTLTGISSIVAGNQQTFALKPDGTVLGWGYNGYGALGDGTATTRYTPVTVGITGVVSLAVGQSHTLAVKSDGTVWAWGYNGYGQLGDRTTTTRYTPGQVTGVAGGSTLLTGMASVSAGPNHSVALKSDGTVYVWGRNNSWGQLGDGTATNRTWPVQVLGSGGVGNLTGVTSIIAVGSEDTTHAIKNDNTLWGWGYNGNGEYGSGTTTTSYTPVQSLTANQSALLAPSGVTAVANAAASSIAVSWPAVTLATSYNLYWSTSPGVNALNGTKVTGATSGVVVTGLTSGTTYYFTVTAVNGGGESTGSAAVPSGFLSSAPTGVSATAKDSSNALSWSVVTGAQSYNVYWSTTAGVTTANGTKVPATAASYTHTGLTNGTPYYYIVTAVFDGNESPASSQVSATPVQVSISKVSIGGGHTVVLKGDGTVWASGYNWYGQLGDGTNTTRTSPVQVIGAAGGTSVLTGITSIAAGDNHTLALKNDGTVWAWGVNSSGELGDTTTNHRYFPVQVFDGSGVSYLSGVTAIYAGASHNFVKKSDGTVWTWGYNWNGQLGDGSYTNRAVPVQVKAVNGSGFLTGISTIFPGPNCTFALNPDGSVLAWGYNAYGQLGDGTTTQRNTPVLAVNISNVVSLASGTNHTLAVKSDGTVWAWGYNGYGQLGDGTTANKTTPVQVRGIGGTGYLTGVVSVAAGPHYSIALKSDGTVYAWGRNDNWAQLGDGTATSRLWPVQVLGAGGVGYLTGVTAIFAVSSEDTTFALKNDNTLWAWGANPNGEYGNGTTTNSWTPVQLTSASNQSVLLAPSGLTASGGVGQITVNWTASSGATSYNLYYSTSPAVTPFNGTKVTGATSGGAITGLTAGTAYYFVVTAVNSVGESNASATVSSMALAAAPVVSAAPGDAKVTLSWPAVTSAISYNVYWSTASGAGTGGTKVSGVSGTSYTHTGRTNGTPYYYVVTTVNAGGESAASAQVSSVPVQLSIAQVSISNGHTVVLKGDGTVWTTGYNGYGQLGDGTTTSRTSYVQVLGPDGIGFLTGVVSIAAAANHTVALKSDGTVWAWGVNSSGELGDNTATHRYTPVQVFGSGGVSYLSGITAIFAGSSHNIAVKNDGTVWAWGYNNYGQLGDATTTIRYVPVQVKGVGGAGFLTGIATIVTGPSQTFALKPDRTVLAWGYNGYGVLGDGTSTTRTAPVIATAISNVVSLAAGAYHTLAVTGDGAVWAWGLNNYGQLGDRTTVNHVAPAQVTGVAGGGSLLTGMASVAAGPHHSIAMKSDGTVYTWGRNDNYAQLGDNTATNRTWPVQVVGSGGVGNLTGVTAIITSGGEDASLALKADNTLWVWGSNPNGEYGNGTTTTSWTPVQALVSNQSALLAPSGVTAVAGSAGQIAVSWTASGGAASYNVYWSTRADVNTYNGAKVTGAASGGAVTGLATGTSYYFVVTAVSAAGESSASAVTSAVAP